MTPKFQQEVLPGKVVESAAILDEKPEEVWNQKVQGSSPDCKYFSQNDQVINVIFFKFSVDSLL